MTRSRCSCTAAAVLSLLVLAGCARGTADGPAAVGADPSAPVSAGASPAGRSAGGPVLQVRHLGGFVTPSMLLSRLPLVGVYADGRVITSAPQTLQYPGPAMATLQVHRLDPPAVDALVAKAVQAGVRSGADFGTPNVADAPSTQLTVVAPGGRQSVEVIALGEARSDDSGLTVAQHQARAKLAAFLRDLTALPDGLGTGRPYQPTAVAAIAEPFPPDGDPAVSVPPAIGWPGPALPGETEGTGPGCVTVSGEALPALLAAAGTVRANTPWTSGGKRWAVTFRQMLPEETGCADLRAQQ